MRAPVSTAVLILLTLGCSSEPTPLPPGEAASDLTRQNHDELTEHLAASLTWTELLLSGADPESDLSQPQLENAATRLEQELRSALDLVGQIQTEAESQKDTRLEIALPRIQLRLQDAQTYLEPIRRAIGPGQSNREALRLPAEHVEEAIDSAAMQHDALASMSTARSLDFRLFALSWPHHQLAFAHEGLLWNVDRMEAQNGAQWASGWRQGLEELEALLDDSRAALRAFADRLDPQLHDYFPERRDDRFNSLTDEIRQDHRDAADFLARLRAELSKSQPSRTDSLSLLEQFGDAIKTAREAHRTVAAELGQPYPDYRSAFGQPTRAESPTPTP